VSIFDCSFFQLSTYFFSLILQSNDSINKFHLFVFDFSFQNDECQIDFFSIPPTFSLKHSVIRHSLLKSHLDASLSCP
jgi:hypothetical protein